jgi:hypothetical protein
LEDKMTLVTFDFDDTLTQTLAVWDEEDDTLEDTEFAGPNLVIIQALHACVANGHEVRVVTSRSDRWLSDTHAKLELFGVLHLLAGVHHTNGQWKAEWMAENDMTPIKHFDDDTEELARFPIGCETVLVPMHPSWKGRG